MFAADHERGWEIGWKQGTASVRPAQNWELSNNTWAEKYYSLVDENIKMKTHQNILDGEIMKMETWMSWIHQMISKERKLNGFAVGS